MVVGKYYFLGLGNLGGGLRGGKGKNVKLARRRRIVGRKEGVKKMRRRR